MGGIGVPQNHWVQHFWKPLNMVGVGISNKINFNIFTVWMALKFFWCFLLQYQIIFDQTYTQKSLVSYVPFQVAITSNRYVRLEEMAGCVHLLNQSRQAAFSEAALLKRLGHHPNIVPWICHLQVSKGS